MDIYGDLFGNIKDKMIDGAVDGVIDNAKGKATLSKTYVWTCINKETHNGSVVNLTFINKLGQRRRVPYDKLSDFCTSEYVSNIVVSDGKVSATGISLSDLPDFRLLPSGQYNCVAVHDENWIYNKAMPYIQSQERLIQEDYMNKCLKTDRSTATNSNLTGNISAIKDISTATAVTAVTAAGMATVAGIGIAGKALFNQLNKGKLTEIQTEICKGLDKYAKLTNELILVKNKTNHKYAADSNLIYYNARVEASSCSNASLANDIRNMGITGCITNIKRCIDAYKSKAISNKVIDMPLKITGVTFGSIAAYISNLEGKVGELCQLHRRTEVLVNNNKQRKYMLEQEEYSRQQFIESQRALISNMEAEVSDIQALIGSFDITNTSVHNIDYILDSFKDNDIENRIGVLKQYASNSINIDTDSNVREDIVKLEKDTKDIKTRLTSIKIANNAQLEQSILSKVREAEESLDSILYGTYAGSDYGQALYNINNTITEVKTQIVSLDENGSRNVGNRLSQLESKLNSKKRELDERIKEVEKDNKTVRNINLTIENYTTKIRDIKKSKDIKSEIDSFNRSVNYDLSYVHNESISNQIKSKVEQARIEFNNLYNNAVDEETRVDEAIKSELDNMRSVLDAEIQKLEELEMGTVTEESLKEFKVFETDDYLITMDTYPYSYNAQVRVVKNKIEDLNRIFRNKYNKYKDILDYDNRAINRLNQTVKEFELKISKLNKYNVENVGDRLDDMLVDSSFNNLQDKSMLTTAQAKLKEMYEAKRSELEP